MSNRRQDLDLGHDGRHSESPAQRSRLVRSLRLAGVETRDRALEEVALPQSGANGPKTEWRRRGGNSRGAENCTAPMRSLANVDDRSAIDASRAAPLRASAVPPRLVSNVTGSRLRVTRRALVPPIAPRDLSTCSPYRDTRARSRCGDTAETPSRCSVARRISRRPPCSSRAASDPP